METKNPILLSYEIDTDGNVKTPSSLPKDNNNTNLSWTHLDALNPKTKDWLKQGDLQLESYIIDALLAEETRPRITETENGMLIILRGVNLNKDSSPEDMVSIRLWIRNNQIISVQRRQLQAVLEIEQKIQNDKPPKNSGDFLCDLIFRLFEKIESKLQDLEEDTDNIEEKILDEAKDSLSEEIVSIRKKAIMYKRYMSSQKEVLLHLRNSQATWLKGNKRHINEHYENIVRYVENLDAIRERAQVVKDELANMLSQKLNNNMYVLSIIAAIFLPLGFLTGLLGINVGGIPGSDNGSAFYIFCGIIIAIVALQIVIFRKLKWLE